MSVISRFFRGSAGSGSPPFDPGTTASSVRRSNGLGELTRRLRDEQGLRVLDLGSTSPQNITYFTSLGFRMHNEDVLLASRDPSLLAPGEDGKVAADSERFIAENLSYPEEFFDAVLCWDSCDYLPEELVKPMVHRLFRIMKPQGLLLGFFHTRDAGPDAPYHRYHIMQHEMIAFQRISAPTSRQEATGRWPHFRLQRVFNNRHIENLFHDFSSIKFFLGRDNMREVLVVR
ncbi:MAG: class I SAM-dependent methyltransferase [Terriglobales bacterium]